MIHVVGIIAIVFCAFVSFPLAALIAFGYAGFWIFKKVNAAGATPEVDDSHFELSKAEDGTDKRASFRCGAFSMDVDFVAKSARFMGNKGTVTDTRATSANKSRHETRFNETLDVIGLSLFSYKDSKITTYAETATGTASGTAFVGGQVVSINAPVTVTTGYKSFNSDTGLHFLVIKWVPTQLSVDGPLPIRLTDGSLRYVRKTGQTASGLEMVVGPVSAATKASFEGVWANTVEVIFKDHEKTLLEHDRAACEVKIKDQEAERAQQLAENDVEAARIRGIASKTWYDLIEQAGVKAEFKSWLFDTRSGAVLEALAVDRDGKAMFSQGDQLWFGSLAGARANVEAMSSQGAKSSDPAYHLEVEVPDAPYEQEHLKRRRFELLANRSRKELLEWADRINILGGKPAA